MTTTYTTKAAAAIMASLPEEDWRNGKLDNLLLIVNLDDEDTLTVTREEADGVIYPDTNIDLAEYEDGTLDRDEFIDLMHYLDKNNMLE
jgi:hypothetical protein